MPTKNSICPNDRCSANKGQPLAAPLKTGDARANLDRLAQEIGNLTNEVGELRKAIERLEVAAGLSAMPKPSESVSVSWPPPDGGMNDT